MIDAKACVRFLALFMMTLAAGCAPAYHCYTDCYVDCNYCPLPALPYTHYEGCACHSCAASDYLSFLPSAVDDVAESDLESNAEENIESDTDDGSDSEPDSDVEPDPDVEPGAGDESDTEVDIRPAAEFDLGA